jgi:cytoskeleton-associated protein 5
MIMAEKSPSFSRAAASLVIGPLSDKLGDLKLKKPSGDALTAFAEKTSLAFVLAQGQLGQPCPCISADLVASI